MKILPIFGKGDKRILAYPLMKCLLLLGKSVVITDDISFNRLYTEETDKKEAQVTLDKKKNIQEVLEIRITHNIEDEYKDLIKEYEDQNFDNCLILSEKYLPDCSNKFIAITTLYKDFAGIHIDEFLGYNEDKDPDLTIFTTEVLNKKDWKDVRIFEWNEDRLLYPYKVEEHRRLLPINDKEINGFIRDKFAGLFDIPAKEFEKLLKRKV